MGKSFGLIGFLLAANSAMANDLGNYGHLFPVLEVDIRQVIAAKLKILENSGQLARYEKEAVGRITAHARRPAPLALSPTKKPETYTVDPSLVVNRDITTPEGLLIAKAGERINPFAHHAYTKTLFFFNGDDKKQVAWVKRHYQDYRLVKFILTGGDISEAADHFGRIYFDQGGTLAKRLHLRHVPAVVRQEGLVWKIREIGSEDA